MIIIMACQRNYRNLLKTRKYFKHLNGKIYWRYPKEKRSKNCGMSWLSEASYSTLWLAKGCNMGRGSLNSEWNWLSTLQFCGTKYSLLIVHVVITDTIYFKLLKLCSPIWNVWSTKIYVFSDYCGGIMWYLTSTMCLNIMLVLNYNASVYSYLQVYQCKWILLCQFHVGVNHGSISYLQCSSY